MLPEYASLAATDTRKAQVILRDLLCMRSGINFYESPYAGSPLERLNTSRDDWLRIAIAEPMNAAPGKSWQYNSGGVIVIGGMIRRAVGGDFYGFARANLFTPIGVTSQRWYYSPFDTLPHTGGGLLITPMDLARIGYLVLRRGMWNNTRLISEPWLDATTTRMSDRPAVLGGHATDYGQLWWLMPLDGTSPTGGRKDAIWMASSNLNNWLFVVPRHDLVVVVTGSDNRSFGAPVDFQYRDVLPAVMLPGVGSGGPCGQVAPMMRAPPVCPRRDEPQQGQVTAAALLVRPVGCAKVVLRSTFTTVPDALRRHGASCVRPAATPDALAPLGESQDTVSRASLPRHSRRHGGRNSRASTR